MNRHTHPALGRAGAIAACAATAGLMLAACGGSSSGGSTAGSATSPSTSASKPAGSSTSTGSTSSVSSNSVPFPIAVGNTWTYEQTASFGALAGDKVIDKVTAVTPVSGGNQVTMSNQIGSNAPTTITYIFHSNGTITYPFNQFGSSVKIVSGSVIWPSAASIDAGQSSTSTIVMAIASGSSTQTVTAHMTIKGDGTTSVTVPAGTYSATVVQMTESFTILGHTGTLVVTTDMANGVGPVEDSVTMNLAGVNETVSQLKLLSFTQG